MVATQQVKVTNSVFAKYAKAVKSGDKTFWEIDMDAIHNFSLAITSGFPEVEVNRDLVYMAENSFGERIPFHIPTGEIGGDYQHSIPSSFGGWYGIFPHKRTGFFFSSSSGTLLYCVPNWRGFYTCMLVEHSGPKSYYRNEIIKAGGISLLVGENRSIFEKYY